MENRDKQDGIRSWYQLVHKYKTDTNRNVRIKRLESVIDTVFHRYYRGGLVKWIQDYEYAFTELALLGKKLGMMMKLRSVALYKMIKILVLLIQCLKN
jgi:hypothetical protein